MQNRISHTIVFSLLGLMALLGSAQAFSNSSLKGTWYAYLSETNPVEGTYWVYGTFDVDSSGNITGGSYTGPDGTAVAVTGGEFLVDEDGIVSGSISSEGGVTGIFPHGKLDKSKTIAAFVGLDSNESMDVGVAIKFGRPGSSDSGCFIKTLLD